MAEPENEGGGAAHAARTSHPNNYRTQNTSATPSTFEQLERRYAAVLDAYVPHGDRPEVRRARLRLLEALHEAASWRAVPEAHELPASLQMKLAADRAEKWVFSNSPSQVLMARQIVRLQVDAARLIDPLER